MNSRSAICPVVNPSAMSSRTSASRLVSLETGHALDGSSRRRDGVCNWRMTFSATVRGRAASPAITPRST